MKYIVMGIILAIFFESLGYTIIEMPPVVGDIAVYSILSYIIFNKINFCNGKKHDWYIANEFKMPNGETQVYIKCRKCGAFEENSGTASARAMLEHEKKHNTCGCSG